MLFLCVISSEVYSASVEYGFFDHYTSKEGIISNRIFSIDCDANGFLWIGTDFGLERFDGKSFKHHRKCDYHEISREDFLFVRALPNGKVTAGGYSGLLVEYDPISDQFKDVKPKEFDESFYKETMNVYLKDDKQIVFTSSGAYIYDQETQSYSSQNTLFKATENLFVRSMYIDEHKRYWLGSMDSMLVCDSQGKRLYGYTPSGDACSFVRTMLPLNDSLLLVVPQSNEMWIFNTKAEVITDPRVIDIPFDCVTNIICDQKGRYWIATDAYGLWYSDDLLAPNPQFTNMIPFNASLDEVRKIYCIAMDVNGNIWFGTQNSGVWCYRKEDLTGITCSWDFAFPQAVCSSFAEDDQHNIVVSVDGGGLYKVDSKYKITSLAKLPNNNVSHMACDASGTCYVASWGGGIYRCNLNTGSFVRERFDGINAPSNCFYGVSVVDGKDVYACSSGDGYYYRKGGENRWKKVIPADSSMNSKWVMTVCGGEEGNRWILAANSLWKEENGRLTAYSQDVNSIKSTAPFNISDLVSDGASLYAATSEGIARYSQGSKNPEMLDFVPKSYYRSIVKDDYGNFWVAGDNGILSFNYEKKACYKLPGNYTDVATFFFYLRSGYKASDGKVYFGTNGGYISIDPAKLKFDTVIPYLSFANLHIGGERVNVDDHPLDGTPISQLSKMSLRYDETNVSFDVDVVDYAKIDFVQCQYRLLGLQNEWQPLPSDKKIKFSHLPVGEFTLEVKASRSNVDCEEKIISMTLRVLPPWWNTWWFYLLMIALLLVLIALGFQWRMRRLIYLKNQLNEQVEMRTLELQNALKDKDSLISVIGHDLRNPMFAIVVALGNWLQKRKTMQEDEKTALIENVYDSAKTLQGEMLKLLDWARSKQDDIACKPQDVDVAHLVEDAVQLTMGMLKRKNIECVRDLQVEHKAVADPRMISAVIRNLLSNAVKFTGEGGRIDITASEEDGKIRITVKDNGVGMSEEVLRKLLSDGAVESTKGTNSEAGTGLGFRFCRKYVQLNNGTMDVTSKEGAGTSITFTLPCSDALIAMEQLEQVSVQEHEQESKELLSDNTILVVDDNTLICENMKSLLGDYCQVMTAFDGQQGLEMAQNNDIDLILSDVDMPVMNGIEMCKRLQADDMLSHIPFLFLSARGDENDRLIGLTNGAIDYIPKPFSQEELFAKLRSILRLKKQERAYLLAQLMQPKQADTEGAEENGEEPVEHSQSVEKENPFLTKFMDLIRERYANTELSVDDLADDLCVSRSTMFRRIKLLVGKSPVELLGEYRLNEAMRRLKESDYESVYEIAYAVGFSDPSYFGKRFKSYFGITPKQVKK